MLSTSCQAHARDVVSCRVSPDVAVWAGARSPHSSIPISLGHVPLDLRGTPVRAPDFVRKHALPPLPAFASRKIALRTRFERDPPSLARLGFPQRLFVRSRGRFDDDRAD